MINTVGGGTAPYQYSINGGGSFSALPTFTGLGAGNYTVIVADALGNSGSQQIFISSAGSPSNSSINLTLCSNDLPYNFNGTNINGPGIYTDTLSNATGCDSIVTLSLVVLPVLSSSVYIAVCPSQLPYTWNGQQYNTGGVYTNTFPGSSGCDSVATLILNTTSAQWLGTINTSWEEPQNWTCGVPGPTSDVYIDNGTVIIHASTSINSLTIDPSVTLTVNTGVNFVILH